jgi:hypothetical protein
MCWLQTEDSGTQLPSILHLNWSLVQLTAFSQWTSSSPPLQSAIPSQTHDERMQPPVSHMYWLGPQVVAKGGTIVIDLGVGVVFEGHPISSLLSPQSSASSHFHQYGDALLVETFEHPVLTRSVLKQKHSTLRNKTLYDDNLGNELIADVSTFRRRRRAIRFVSSVRTVLIPVTNPRLVDALVARGPARKLHVQTLVILAVGLVAAVSAVVVPVAVPRLGYALDAADRARELVICNEHSVHFRRHPPPNYYLCKCAVPPVRSSSRPNRPCSRSRRRTSTLLLCTLPFLQVN